jgi:predicted deacylase
MLARTTISALAAGAAALALTGWTDGIGSPRALRSVDNSPGAIAVDVELVIPVDVSNSMARREAVTISRSQLSKVLRKKGAFAGVGRGTR